MDDTERARAGARYLADERRAGRAFSPIPEAIRPRDADEAFRTQVALQSLLVPSLGEIVGRKVALTTRVMQQMVGYGEPVPGAIFASTVHASGDSVALTDYRHLGIECELALRLDRSLGPADAPFDRARVAGAVSDVMAAFELVDDRDVDYDRFASNVLSFIADNAWNAGAVLGAPCRDWRDIDLAAIEGTARVGGTPYGNGHGRDVLGHPLDALVFLADSLAARGEQLPSGALVMTGSIIATRFVSAGEHLRFELGELPPVEVLIR